MLTDQQHPITPPPELVEQWCRNWTHAHGEFGVYLATQAARWGFRQCIKVDAARLEDKLQKARDQELEACCSWADATGWYGAGDMLRAVRRPKPPSSLNEQALTQLDSLHDVLKAYGFDINTDTIRRALERLQELENNG